MLQGQKGSTVVLPTVQWRTATCTAVRVTVHPRTAVLERTATRTAVRVAVRHSTVGGTVVLPFWPCSTVVPPLARSCVFPFASVCSPGALFDLYSSFNSLQKLSLFSKPEGSP